MAPSSRRAISRLVVSRRLARARLGIEVGGKARAVGTERLKLRGEPLLGAVGLAPALQRGVERIQRRRKALGRSFDAGVGHGLPRRLQPRRVAGNNLVKA